MKLPRLNVPKVGQSNAPRYGNLPDRYRTEVERSIMRPFLPKPNFEEFKAPKIIPANGVKLAHPHSFQFGGVVQDDGMAMVHQGERVLTPEEQAVSDLPPVPQTQLDRPDDAASSPAPQVNAPTSTGDDGDSTIRLSELHKMLTHPVLMENYKPSLARKLGGGILGGLTGFAFSSPKEGAEEAQSITQAPYKRAAQDYATKVGALEKGATIDTNAQNARSRALTAAAGVQRVLGALNPDLQGAIAGAKTGAQVQAKGGAAPLMENYTAWAKLPENEDKSFKDYIDEVQNKSKGTGTVRNIGHISVSDARSTGTKMNDIDGNPINISQYPDNMQFNLISAGNKKDGGIYYMPASQGTAGFTADNIAQRVTNLSATPVRAGVAKPPTTTTHEEEDIAPGGQPVAQTLVSGTSTQTGPIPNVNNQPNNQPPITIPPNRVVPPNISSPGSVNSAPGGVPKVNPPAVVSPPGATNITPRTPPGTRPLTAFKSAEMDRQTKYSVPASAAMTQIVGKQDDPNAESMMTFAHLANDKHAIDHVGEVVKLISQRLDDAQQTGENVGVQLAGFGAQAQTGGFWDFLKNKTGLTRTFTKAQNDVINDAVKELTPEERHFVDKIFATYGDLSAFRSILRGSAYKWASNSLKAEMPVPGYSDGFDSSQSDEVAQRLYYTKIAAFMNSINDGLKSANISPTLLPQQKYWDDKTKNLNELSIGKAPVPPKKSNYTFKKVGQ